MARLRSLIILLLLGSVLTGCGIRGDLERPPPLWGPTLVEAEADGELPPPDLIEEDEDEEDPGYGVEVAN